AAGGDRPARRGRVEALGQLGGQLGDEAVVAGEAAGPAGPGRQPRVLEEAGARRHGLGRLGATAADADAVALRRVEGLLEGQAPQVVLRHQPVQLSCSEAASLPYAAGRVE